MKPTSITIQHVRQVRQYEPVTFSITADLKEGEDVMQAAKALQSLVLQIIFKDKPIERDSLIKQLVDVTDTKTGAKPHLSFDSEGGLKSKKTGIVENSDFFKEKQDQDPDPFPDFQP